MSIEPVMPSNHLILCRPLLLLPSTFPSIGFFSNESVLRIRWPKYWSFSFSISPSNEYSGLISFRIDLLDLLAVQGTLKSLLQQHSTKASILQRSAVFIVQLSHPYMTTGKTIALTIWAFVAKVLSLLFNMLSRLVMTFLPRSKHPLISWLPSPLAVILEPPKIKSVIVNKVSPSGLSEITPTPGSTSPNLGHLVHPRMFTKTILGHTQLSSGMSSLVVCQPWRGSCPSLPLLTKALVRIKNKTEGDRYLMALLELLDPAIPESLK